MRKVTRGCNWVLINSGTLNKHRNNIVNIVIDKNKYSIIKGTIYSVDGLPCYGATIEINEVNLYNNKRKLLGYVVTDKKGEYQFIINAIYNMDYEIKVYSPIKISRS